jgi:intracellular multiplication protein IcmX
MNINYQKILKKCSALFFLTYCLIAHTQQTTPDVGAFGPNPNPQTDDNFTAIQDIKKELLNFGYYFGFPIDANKQVPPLDQFFQKNVPNVINLQKSVVKQLMSIFSANVFQPSFIPTSGSGTNNSPYSALNDLANSVLSSNQVYNPQFDVALTKTSGPNNIPLSPASQMVLNILSYTPDDACIINTGSTKYWNTSCKYTFTTAMVYANALGISFDNGNLLAKQQTSSQYNALSNGNLINLQQFYPQGNMNGQSTLLTQLDSSVFLSPLVYNTQSSNQSSNKILSGLDSSNQMLAAESFLRHVTGTIIPPNIATEQTLEQVQNKIVNATDIVTQLGSFKSLSNYILGSRVYAARESVALQNIYEMMSRRMPYANQNTGSSGMNAGIPSAQSQSSQALNEFIMATYRLYNPGTDANQSGSGQNQQAQWQSMIANASTANVQRETALLLAEINYQLFLMRQQQERLLLTNSLLLLNNLQYPNLEPPNQ